MKKLPVPALRQPELACGPTSLEMVLKYYGEDVPVKTIIKEVGGLRRKIGVRTIKLADFAKKLGYKIECYSYNEKLAMGRAIVKKPSKSDIIRFLYLGIPVIISVSSHVLHGFEGGKQEPSGMGHFIVITGYKNGKFLYNNPRDGKKHSINEDDMVFAWHSNILNSSAYLLALYPKSF